MMVTVWTVTVVRQVVGLKWAGSAFRQNAFVPMAFMVRHVPPVLIAVPTVSAQTAL